MNAGRRKLESVKKQVSRFLSNKHINAKSQYLPFIEEVLLALSEHVNLLIKLKSILPTNTKVTILGDGEFDGLCAVFKKSLDEKKTSIMVEFILFSSLSALRTRKSN